jgi:hypothetical protein
LLDCMSYEINNLINYDGLVKTNFSPQRRKGRKVFLS